MKHKIDQELKQDYITAACHKHDKWDEDFKTLISDSYDEIFNYRLSHFPLKQATIDYAAKNVRNKMLEIEQALYLIFDAGYQCKNGINKHPKIMSEDFEELEQILNPKISTEFVHVDCRINAGNGQRLVSITNYVSLKRPIKNISIIFEYE